MDEKTEELRDIFLDVADEETVTESQTASRGTLAESDEPVEERLADVVARMRDRLGFRTDLADDVYCRVVYQFHDDQSDETIADDLGLDPATVFEARADLHLVRDDDASVALASLRDHLDPETVDEDDVAAAATALSADEEPTRRAIRVVQARDASRRVSHRYRSEFEEILTDADLAVRLTADAQEDGLREATEDADVDVDF